MSKARDIADSAATINALDGVTATGTELNILDGVTATTAELNILDGVTSTAAELNILDGVTATTAELNYVDGVTSNIQTQIDNISVTAGTLTKTFAQNEVATINLSSSITTPVVSVTKEVNQTGVTNNTWDVNSTTENYTRLDSAPATTLYFSGFDISTATYSQSFSVSSQDTIPTSVEFNDDGTKMFVVGINSDNVNEYNLSTAYDVSTATYSQAFSVATEDAAPNAIRFNTDGTKMFIVGYTGQDINEYTLSTGFDVSTATYSQNFSVSAQETSPIGLAFNSDGTKMFVIGDAGDDVNEYTLSTGFDVSTATYSQNFSVSAQDTYPNGITFNLDGTKMFVIGQTGDSVYEYTLSTGFDVSTATYSQSFSVSSQDTNPRGIAFNPSGTKMFIVGYTNDSVYEYNIDVASLALGSGSFSSADVGKTIEANGGKFVLTATDGSYVETTAPTSYAQVASGSWEMYGVVYNTTDGDLQLSGGLLNKGDISTATFNQSEDVSARGTTVLGVTFKPDGTFMYVTFDSNNDCVAFQLTTAWDISTATYATYFGFGAQDTTPAGIAFNNDGTRIYMVGYAGTDINEYDLSTAYSVNTATYSRNFSVSSQTTQPYDIKFNSDGTKMFVTDNNNVRVLEYALSEAFRVDNATFTQAFSLSSQMTNAYGLAFNSDGTKMYVSEPGDIFQYTLSTGFDISTASYSGKTVDVSATASIPVGLFLKPDETKIFIGVYSANNIDDYNIGTEAVLTGYHSVHTTTSTDSTYWTDINSMTADETAGNGSIFYCVSTDDRSTWKIAKASDGERSIVRNNSGTWQYNSNGTYASTTWTNATTNTELNALQEAMTGASTFDAYDLTNASYDSVTFATSGQDNSSHGFVFANSGTKAYIAGNTNRRIYEYTLSTAYDISTASYSSNSFYINEDSYINGVAISSDGTKMYVGGLATSSVYEYDLSTAYDVSTASYNSVSFNVSSQTTTNNGPIDIFFKPDGTKMYVSGQTPKYVWQYALSTAWDLSTASYDNKVSSEGVLTHFTISSDGTVLIKAAGSTVSKFNMSTAWDISTASSTADQTLDTTGTEAYNSGIKFNADGSKLILLGRITNDALYQWSSTGPVSYPNQMNKTQLDAVSDANHFTLANDLDLGIIFNLSSGTTVPSSNGVSINYDANVLNKGAILGTDYDFDAPAATKVRITALAANNLKVRVV